MKNTMNKPTIRLLPYLMLAIMLTLISCKGPSGTDGAKGSKGDVGAIGPAGEDGSVMYAGKGAPSGNIGTEGDYYLNNKTGELYGPKDGDGWGTPSIVLMGDSGKDGKDGQDGSEIHAGKGKPAGSLGNTGDFYLNQNNGDFYGPKTDSGWDTPTNLKGEDGQDGTDGQDGADGSQIYSGTGAPVATMGVVGDFYLNKGNGDFYGPKTNSGWGTPTNLKGEDGQDGTDGQDGADGEDGTQIYSGAGAPNSGMGVTGDFYLDKSNYDVYGPKTGSSWGSPINLKGADGNANVTRYIFPGHDFSDTKNQTLRIAGLTEQEVHQSAWLVYIVTDEVLYDDYYFSIPAEIGGDMFTLYHYYNGTKIVFELHAKTLSQYNFKRTEVVRIAASATEDHTKQVGGITILPKDLDTSNYREVAKYYGFDNATGKVLKGN